MFGDMLEGFGYYFGLCFGGVSGIFLVDVCLGSYFLLIAFVHTIQTEMSGTIPGHVQEAAGKCEMLTFILVFSLS